MTRGIFTFVFVAFAAAAAGCAQTGRGAGATSAVPEYKNANFEGNKVYFGSPVVDAKEKKKELVWIRRIPEIWEKLQELMEKRS